MSHWPLRFEMKATERPSGDNDGCASTPEKFVTALNRIGARADGAVTPGAPDPSTIESRDVEGWPAEDVCNALDVSETNQRVLLHRARSKVRRALEDYFTEAQ